jgi:hypothetical protein
MAKIVRLTESQLKGLINKVIAEQNLAVGQNFQKGTQTGAVAGQQARQAVNKAVTSAANLGKEVVVTIGKTTFYMGVTSCSTAAAITPKLYLSSAGASGGYLTTGITNVVLELLDASGNSLSLTSSPTAYPGTTWASFTPAATGTYYEKSFSVQYRATGAGGSGTVSGASMTVALLYS